MHLLRFLRKLLADKHDDWPWSNNIFLKTFLDSVRLHLFFSFCLSYWLAACILFAFVFSSLCVCAFEFGQHARRLWVSVWEGSREGWRDEEPKGGNEGGRKRGESIYWYHSIIIELSISELYSYNFKTYEYASIQNIYVDLQLHLNSSSIDLKWRLNWPHKNRLSALKKMNKNWFSGEL